MKIIEVRDGFIRLESEDKLKLSSFLRINSFERSYIAQIVQVKNSGNYACAKLVYLYNEGISPYDNTLPSKDSTVEHFDFANINSYFDVKLPVVPGKFISGDLLKLDKDVLSSLLVCVEDSNKAYNIIQNISQKAEKSAVIDLTGNIKSDRKYTAGADFKLPLNSSTLQFMYEDCMNDVTSESKDLIKEIFKDLAEYSKTVDFMPFNALKTIVDDMVDKAHVFKLLVLKTKLAKFDRLGYFAGTKGEADKLAEILKTDKPVIDLSKLDSKFQNRYLETILQLLDGDSSETLVFANVSNLIDKKMLKSLVKPSKNNVVLLASPKFKYINDIKTMYKNFIIEPSFVNNTVFKPFASIMSSMNNEEVLFIGEASERLPLVLIPEVVEFTKDSEKVVTDTKAGVENYDDESLVELSPEEEAIDKKSSEVISQIADELETTQPNDVANLFEETEQPEVHEVYDTPLESGNDYHTTVDDTKIIDVEDEILELDGTQDADDDEVLSDIEAENDNIQLTETDEVVEDNAETEVLVPEYADSELPNDISSEYQAEILNDEEPLVDTNSEEFSVEEIGEDVSIDDSADFDEIIEMEDDSTSIDDALADLGKEEPEETAYEDELDKEIAEDVDKVYTTMKDDTISDEDLDFIDELNGDISVADEELVISDDFEPVEGISEENEEEGFLEPLEEVGNSLESDKEEKEILETRNNATPIVPVYDADIPQEDRVVSDPIEQGDTVVHAKYGTGVVEKMIKYGNKNLYSINFDNVGRRLLDPTLTEIKKA